MMSTRLSFACALVLGAGCISGVVVAGEEAPTVLEPSHGVVRDVAHIYYNLATGERVVTLLGDGQTAGANTVNSQSIWACLNTKPCASEGFTTAYFFGVDNPGSTSLSTAITLSDFGDIVSDTVVDCIYINWVVAHHDVDSDSDGAGDGVRGLGGVWGVWDLDNGRSINQCDRVPLVEFLITDLPGNILGDGSLSGYSADIDLVGALGGDLSFEICDTDGDPQGAAFHHPFVGTFDNNFDGFPDSDLDQDGLSDWGWSVRFFQPGTIDFDGDGVPDGIPAPTDADTIGVSFAVPDGTAINNGDGTWTWDIDTSTPDAGNGQEDSFAVYDANGLYAGLFYFGGFSCDPVGPGYTPAAMFEFQLYGPGYIDDSMVCGDLDGNGVNNFFDISLFLQAFIDHDPIADYTYDGEFNFFDVTLFITAYTRGCP